MIGRNGERGSRISAPAARHDDDDILLMTSKRQILFNQKIHIKPLSNLSFFRSLFLKFMVKDFTYALELSSFGTSLWSLIFLTTLIPAGYPSSTFISIFDSIILVFSLSSTPPSSNVHSAFPS